MRLIILYAEILPISVDMGRKIKRRMLNLEKRKQKRRDELRELFRFTMTTLWEISSLIFTGLLWMSIGSILLFLYLSILHNSFHIAFEYYMKADLKPFIYIAIYGLVSLSTSWISHSMNHIHEYSLSQKYSEAQKDLSEQLDKIDKTNEITPLQLAPIVKSILIIVNKGNNGEIEKGNTIREKLNAIGKSHRTQIMYVLPIVASFIILAFDRSSTMLGS